MTRRLLVSAEACRDIVEHGVSVSEAGSRTLDRFIDAIELAFDRLKRHPEIGRVRDSKHRRLKNIRQLPIRGFSNFVIFYQVRAEEIEVARILHGARDVDEVLRHLKG